MKKWYVIFAVLVAVLLGYGIALSADVDLKWDAVTGAVEYRLYKSEDHGLTWSAPVIVGNVTTYVWKDVVETGLVLFRASAKNAKGVEAVRLISGAWYDKTQGMDSPGGTGIK